MSGREDRANLIADRIISGVEDADGLASAIEYLTRALSFMAVKFPAAIDEALDYADSRNAS